MSEAIMGPVQEKSIYQRTSTPSVITLGPPAHLIIDKVLAWIGILGLFGPGCYYGDDGRSPIRHTEFKPVQTAPPLTAVIHVENRFAQSHILNIFD
jgi:hypothetical protein